MILFSFSLNKYLCSEHHFRRSWLILVFSAWLHDGFNGVYMLPTSLPFYPWGYELQQKPTWHIVIYKNFCVMCSFGMKNCPKSSKSPTGFLLPQLCGCMASTWTWTRIATACWANKSWPGRLCGCMCVRKKYGVGSSTSVLTLTRITARCWGNSSWTGSLCGCVGVESRGGMGECMTSTSILSHTMGSKQGTVNVGCGGLVGC